jgi:putative addiction module component (TIGR02574 family)
MFVLMRRGQKMPRTLDTIKSEVSKLTDRDRAELAYFLISSLDPKTDPNAEAAWDAELARREAEIETGKVIGRPADEVFTRLREKYS